jgi:lipopolysaccharide exporter
VSDTKALLNSSLILLLMKFIHRGIGLISTIILARMLSPDDFGILAIVTLIIYFFEILANLGTEQYIIQKENLEGKDLDTAWTLNIIVKSGIFAVFLITIPYIVDFYQQESLTLPLYCISLLLLISSLHSPGVMVLKREYNYKPILKLSFIQKIITFSVTISLVYYLKSYWAMVIGILVSELILMVGSYLIHSYRPKFSLQQISIQWKFSQWVMLKGILGYSRAQIDTILISKSFNLDIVGGFNMMKNISAMPGSDIIAPATEPLLASFSKVKNNINELSFQFNLSFFVISLISIPIAFFMYHFHTLIVVTLLGEKWLPYSNLMGVMSLLFIGYALGNLINHLCIATERVKTIFYYDLISFIITFLILITFTQTDIYQFVVLRALLSLALTAIMFIYMFRKLNSSLVHIIKLIIPIMISCYISVTICQQFLLIIEQKVIVELLISILICGMSLIILIAPCYALFYKNTREGKKVFQLLSDGSIKLKRKIYH